MPNDPIRHVVEVRHQSFASPSFTDLLRRHQVTVASVDDDNHPAFGEVTGGFIRQPYVQQE